MFSPEPRDVPFVAKPAYTAEREIVLTPCSQFKDEKNGLY
jgi:hypothetical protein